MWRCVHRAGNSAVGNAARVYRQSRLPRTARSICRAATVNLSRLNVQARSLSVSGRPCSSDDGGAGLPPERLATARMAGAAIGRTHRCGELREEHDGESVTLCGWIQKARVLSDSLAFVPLRDNSGLIQLTLNEETKGTAIHKLPAESVVSISGTVRKRPPNMVNAKQQTGAVEVEVTTVTVLNIAARLPFPPDGRGDNLANDLLRQQYRYLDLRRAELQRALQVRSSLALLSRRILADRHNFLEIETPTLFKRTPGGAAEFPVPTQNKGEFYTLVQSPQQFKQLLMVGGLDRYFQIARCYRDEGGRGDRQPEFTQIDLELSFTSQREIEDIIEELVVEMWQEGANVLPQRPFQRMSYSEAMSRFGVDKPDLRFGLELLDVSEHLGCETESAVLQKALGDGNALIGLRVPQGRKVFTNKVADRMQEYVRGIGGDGALLCHVSDNGGWKSPIARHVSDSVRSKVNHAFHAEPGDSLIMAVGPIAEAQALMGKIRLWCADTIEAAGVPLRDPNAYEFLWVDGFPLFERDEDGVLRSTHHVFTAPVAEDVDLLETNPEQVRGQHFDLVLNGVELGGGSIRNHDAEVQRYIVDGVLGEDVSAFQHMITALSFGAPPHGGIALGFDRLVMVMLGVESLRDVLAFPKSFAGRDLMGGSPCTVDPMYLKDYHIEVK